MQHAISAKKNQDAVGKTFEVLVENDSKRSSEEWKGRNDQNNICVFPKGNSQKGDLVQIVVSRATGTTLIGSPTD